MFFILARSTDGGQTWVDDFEEKYDTGKEAAEEADRLNKCYRNSSWHWQAKQRVRVRRVVNTDNDNFLVREAAKNHNYVDMTQLPDYAYTAYWRLAHFHPNDPKKIRFFRNIENAIAERYTVATVTRYLTTYCELDIADCEEYLIAIGYYSGAAEFEILRDADAIEAAYVHGPTSCMNDPEDYPLPDIHPARVYASPDLGLAVVKRGNEITGRCLVRMDKKLYGRAYGHVKLLNSWLDEQGFRHTIAQTPWAGARMMRLIDEDEDNRLICPYLDVSHTVSLARDKRYIRMAGRKGKLYAQRCDGYASESRFD